MTKLILIAVLLFTANVAGAEQPACGGWCANGFIQAKDSCDCVKEQSEAGLVAVTPKEIAEICGEVLKDKEQPEAEESDAEKCERVCLNEYFKNGRYDTPPYFPEATKIFNGCLESCNPNDAEKWRGVCQSASEKLYFGYKMSPGELEVQAQIATAYCLRALLEDK